MQPLSENAVNVPAFLNKLWRMVNDPSTDQLISWGSGGKSFIIQNQAQFWYELLPVYYKHNNMSSFVRQLNMYGFHKMSTVENGTTDNEKDEIQFFHQYFRKDQPESLTLIKRKVTATKVATTTPVQNGVKSDDLTRILSDVKHLRGKQAGVDSQLSSMKQENAVLWRELAMLRQKHMKQQQIINKLIQFLVTIVQPNPRMSGLGVKRHYPLMLHECPQAKNNKKPSTDGPTIHELDNSECGADEFFCKSKRDLLEANMSDENTNPLVDELLSDTELPNEPLVDEEQTNKKDDNLEDAQDVYSSNEKIFLNSTAPDTLLTNLINGSYNSDLLSKDNNKQSKKDGTSNDLGDLAVAKRVEYSRLNSMDDLDVHLETTQSEIDQLKDILHGCNGLDANALLGLFTDDAPDYVLTYQDDDDPSKSGVFADPLVSGSELTTYNTNLMDFSQLFDDDSSDPQDPPPECVPVEDASSSINTPQISNQVPIFPVVKKEKIA